MVGFIAMSFHQEEEPALIDNWEAMQRAVASIDLPTNLTRMDMVEGDYEISQEIMRRINKANFIIVDFTLSPRNVYFEAGYARGRGKHIIQTARSDTKLAFDTRNWRTLFYKNATELEATLCSATDVRGGNRIQERP